MKKAILMVFILIVFIMSCAKDMEPQFIGTWEYSIYEESEETKDGYNITVSSTIKGTATYHIGNKYEEEAKAKLVYTIGDKAMTLNFLGKEAGAWMIKDNVLLTTIEDGFVEPTDTDTKNVVDNNPEVAAELKPVKGESISYKIYSVSDSLIVMKNQKSNTTYTLKKQ